MSTSSKKDILSMLPAEIEQILVGMGEARYRAKQLLQWLHQKRTADFSPMQNLSAPLREKLSECCFIPRLKELHRQTAEDRTVKFLFELPDGNTVETVLMRHDYGNSLCISSQVGCAMGCTFCASTLGGKVRNLSAGEMLEQIYLTKELTGGAVDSIVLMGIGEPLDNFENLLRFLELVRLSEGLGMSHRRISLSTCGLADRIDELARHRLQLTLSVSLHAPDNALRNELMPINRKFPIAVLMGACRRYFEATGRRISYEYALMDGVNDSLEQADALAMLLKGQNCHVNLIPVNPVKERAIARSGRQQVQKFFRRLEEHNISVTVRRELGGQIDAACGQLRQIQAKGE
jgi:23S rRNA (adenine2503-C2)-methyltransferase